MNKYQEALEIIKNRNSKIKINHRIGSRNIANEELKECFIAINNSLKTLQELVDKATPKEVIVDDSEYEKYGENDYKCPSCNSWLRPDIFIEKHCFNCGQKIDWSE